jgi:hypothetical protein
VVRIAGATRMLGLRFANPFGGKALHIGTVHVAEAGENGASLPTPIILSPSRASGSEERGCRRDWARPRTLELKAVLGLQLFQNWTIHAQQFGEIIDSRKRLLRAARHNGQNGLIADLQSFFQILGR